MHSCLCVYCFRDQIVCLEVHFIYLSVFLYEFSSEFICERFGSCLLMVLVMSLLVSVFVDVDSDHLWFCIVYVDVGG